MLRGFFSVLFLIICLFNISLCYADVRLDFNENQNTILNGNWEFYPKQFILSGQHNLNITTETVVLPNAFKSLIQQKDYFGTFQQTFLLPKDAYNEQLSLYIPYQYGAYELFINGQLMAKAGNLGQTKFNHRTEMSPRLVKFYANTKSIEIVIHASSFDHIRGGLENPIYIGYSKPINHYFYQQIIPNMIISGVLIMVGLFMVIFSSFRYSQGYNTYGWLFLGIFILAFSVRSWFAVPFSYTLFTNISWLWGTRLEYLLTQIACISFLTYIYLLPHKLLHRFLFYICFITIIINIVVTLLSEPIVFQSFFFQSFSLSILFLLNIIFGFYRMWRQKISYSKANAIAILILCLTFLHDYLLGLGLIQSIEIAFYSSCLYFVLVTLQICHDYANQSHKTALLNKELIDLNANLDLQVSERTATVTALNEKLNHQLKIDALTGAFNRYALNLEIKKYFELVNQEVRSLAFFMIDVDFFKNYNDAYGHLKGDDVLKSIVENLQCVLPNESFLARYGGEEFAIILPDVSFDVAQQYADAWLQVIKEISITHDFRKDEKRVVTISIGGAVHQRDYAYATVMDLMKKADQNLYRAKEKRDSAVVES